MSGSSSKSVNRIKPDSDILAETDATTIRNNELCQVDNNKCVDRKKFSCWDDIDPAWLIYARQDGDDRIYIHGDILEWLVEHINKNILNVILRANVEEVHHHNLDGYVYLLKFYKFYTYTTISYEMRKLIYGDLKDAITAIKDWLKYKMPWKTNPTYFLRVDSIFADRKAAIITRLQELNLHDCFVASQFDVNWLYIPKIEVYEFLEYLSDEQVKQIDLIFQEMSKSRAPIYVCSQFDWHQEVCDYVDMDTTAMDICVEDWVRHDLLDEFSVEDVLRLDLANKDYRDAYWNEYLDRYLDKLLKKLLPQLDANYHEKLEFPLYRLQPYLRHYFVSRFYDKISILYGWDGHFVDHLYTYDIPIIEISRDTLKLNGDEPKPEVLLSMESHPIKYNIANYTYFGDSLFRSLLNKSSDYQRYNIKFGKDFNFMYEKDQPFVLQLTNGYNWTKHQKRIFIELEGCTEINADKLTNFVKYLINLFNDRIKLDIEVWLRFVNCMLEDYTFLKDIGNSIDNIHFSMMKISPGQVRKLGCALASQKSVTFQDCIEMTDSDVMSLLEHIDFNHLRIIGGTACSLAIHYLMAEHLMKKECVDTIKANRFNGHMNGTRYNFYYYFDSIEFFKDSHQIVARYHHSKKIVDLYCLLNGIADDECVDSSNNMFMQ